MKRLIVMLAMLVMAQGVLAEEDKSLAQKAGEGVKKGGEAAGHAIEKGGEAVGRGVQKGMEAAASAVKKAETWAGKKMQEGGKKLEKEGE